MIFVSFPYDNTKILLNRKKKKKKKNRLMIIKALSHDDPDVSSLHTLLKRVDDVVKLLKRVGDVL